MKHYIIAKFKPEVTDRPELCARIADLFTAATQIPGIYSAEVYPNCIDRANRFDVMIVLDMDKAAFTAWDDSPLHRQWKENFGELLEKKAILDHE